MWRVTCRFEQRHACIHQNDPPGSKCAQEAKPRIRTSDAHATLWLLKRVHLLADRARRPGVVKIAPLLPAAWMRGYRSGRRSLPIEYARHPTLMRFNEMFATLTSRQAAHGWTPSTRSWLFRVSDN